MPRGYISKDSLSPCDSPSMLYDAVRRPHSPTIPSKPTVRQDTIESTPKPFKQDLCNRLHSRGLELPHESYIAVVQVGKYIFLAVMLPVYFGVYGIPHWFFATAFPQLFGFFKQQSIQVGRFAAEISKRVFDLMKGAMEQLLGDSLRLARDRAKNLWNLLTATQVHYSQKLSLLTNKLKNKHQQVASALMAGWKALHRLVEHNVQKTNRWIYTQAVSLAKKGISKAVRFLTFADRYALTPFMRLVVTPFQWVAKGVLVGKKYISQILDKINRERKKITDPWLASIKKRTTQAVAALEETMRPVIDWLEHKRNAIKSFIQKTEKMILDPVQIGISKTKEAVNQWIVHGLASTRSALRFTLKGFKGAGRFAWKMTPQRIKENIYRKKKALYHFCWLLKSVFYGIVAIMKWILRRALDLLLLLYKWGIQLFHQSIRFVQWLRKKTKGLPKRVFKVTLKWTAFVGLRLAFAAHLVIVLIALAAIYGFRLTQEVSKRGLKATKKQTG